jgi:hypothetical protein
MLSALDRIEHELVTAGHRHVARRRAFRRRVANWLAALVATLAIASGTSAVAGVGPLAGHDDQTNSAPASGAPFVTVSRRGVDGHDWAALVFAGIRHSYCIQLPPLSEVPPAPGRGGVVSQGVCQAGRVVVANFGRSEPAVVTISQILNEPGVSPTTLVAGIVPADATAVTVTDTRAGISRHATLTKVWTRRTKPAARAFLTDLPQTDRGHTTRLEIITQTPTGSHASRWPPLPRP